MPKASSVILNRWLKRIIRYYLTVKNSLIWFDFAVGLVDHELAKTFYRLRQHTKNLENQSIT